MTCSDLPVKNVQILSSNSENVLFSKGIRILYVLEGSCSFVINERSIYGQSGDFFFFLPSIQPGSVLLSGSVSSRLIWIAFDMSFFYEHVPGWEGLHVELSKNIERHRELFRQILTQIASVWFGSPKTVTWFFNLWALIWLYFSRIFCPSVFPGISSHIALTRLHFILKITMSARSLSMRWQSICIFPEHICQGTLKLIFIRVFMNIWPLYVWNMPKKIWNPQKYLWRMWL